MIDTSESFDLARDSHFALSRFAYRANIIGTRERSRRLLRQIELSASANNLTIIGEILLENFFLLSQADHHHHHHHHHRRRNNEDEVDNNDNNDKHNNDNRCEQSAIALLREQLRRLFARNCGNISRSWLTHRITFRFVSEIDNDNSRIIGDDSDDPEMRLIMDSAFVQLYHIFADNNQPIPINASSSSNGSLKRDDVIALYRELFSRSTSTSASQSTLEKNEHLQSMLIKLKNSLFTNPIFTSNVIDIFSTRYTRLLSTTTATATATTTAAATSIDPHKLNVFDKIYLQALIHSLKNENRTSMIDVLRRCPDAVLRDDSLLCQIIEYFVFSQNQKHHKRLDTITAPDRVNRALHDLYAACLCRRSAQLIRTIYAIRLRDHKYRTNFFNPNSPFFFHLKECFLYAVHEGTHFLSRFRAAYCGAINRLKIGGGGESSGSIMTSSTTGTGNPNKNSTTIIDISRLPTKAQIMLIFISLYDLINNRPAAAAVNDKSANHFIEKIVRFESIISGLLIRYESENFELEDDRTFARFVAKLRFVLDFADWCHRHINWQRIERNHFCYGIIVSLLAGSSPLKILSSLGFLQLEPTAEDGDSAAGGGSQTAKKPISADCAEICSLIAQYDRDEAMMLKGFAAIRLCFRCILAPEGDSIGFEPAQLKSLLQDIVPYEFRIEIMENIFAMLFLTKSDLHHHHHHRWANLNSSIDDEDYLDESLQLVGVKRPPQPPCKDDANRLFALDNSGKNGCFLAPNWIIPMVLEILKTVLYKTSSDIYTIAHHHHHHHHHHRNQAIEQEIGDLSESKIQNALDRGSDFEECRYRINALLKHVGDAHFRYDVIRPAFYKNAIVVAERQTNPHSDDNCQIPPASAAETPKSSEVEDDLNNRIIRDPILISTATSSDADPQINPNLESAQFGTSLISCMLASHTQLLCYTLIENSIDNAVKIVRLFKDDLKHSKEYKELQLLEYFAELHRKIGDIYCNFSEFDRRPIGVNRRPFSSSNITRPFAENSKNEENGNGNNGGGGDRLLKISEIANLGIRTSKIQSLVYEMLLKMDKIDGATKRLFMIDYTLASSPSLEITGAIMESIFAHNHQQSLYQATPTGAFATTSGTAPTIPTSSTSGTSLSTTTTSNNNNSGTKLFPEKVENFLHNFQRLIADLAGHLDASQLSIGDFLEKSIAITSSSGGSKWNIDTVAASQSFVNALHIESQLRGAYCEFHSHLAVLENRLIDEPDLLLPENSARADAHFRRDSQISLSLFDKITDYCPIGCGGGEAKKYHYLSTLLQYVRKVSKALAECKKRNQQAAAAASGGSHHSHHHLDSSLIFSTSYFAILKQSPSAILCSMVIKSKMSPKMIDDLAHTMKVNLIGVLCSVYCPSIVTTFLNESSGGGGGAPSQSSSSSSGSISAKSIDHQQQDKFYVNDLSNPCLYELIEKYCAGESIHCEPRQSLRGSLVSNFFAPISREVDESFDANSAWPEADCCPGSATSASSFQPLINAEVLNYFNSKCSILVELLRMLALINDGQVAQISTQSAINMHIYADSPLRRSIARILQYFGGNGSAIAAAADITAATSLAFYPRITPGHPAVIRALEHYAANQNYFQIYNIFKLIDCPVSSAAAVAGTAPQSGFTKMSQSLRSSSFDNNRVDVDNNRTSAAAARSSFETLQNAIYARLVYMKQDAKFVFHLVDDPQAKCEIVDRLLNHTDAYNETFDAVRLVRLVSQSIAADESRLGIDCGASIERLDQLLRKIEFFAAVGRLTGLKTWKASRDNLSSIDMLTIIKSRKRYALAIDWYRICGTLESETADLHIELLIRAYSEANDYAALRRLFHSVIDEMMQSTDGPVSIVERTLSVVDNLELRAFLVDLLVAHYRKRANFDAVRVYERYLLGIELVKLISRKCRPDYMRLIGEPALLVEQLLMNGEIDSLERIVNRGKLINADDLVERYAQKAVYIEIYDGSNASFTGSDITTISLSAHDSGSERASTATATTRTFTTFTSSTNSSGNHNSNNNNNNPHQPFVVPEKIPSRNQWISDAAETHCMICHLVRFSMINRRHHCRRCGRVVCQACSPNTHIITKISTTVAVRVCTDCHRYLREKDKKLASADAEDALSSNDFDSNGNTFGIRESDQSKSNIRARTIWCLSPTDEAANDSRRNEFVYETAPSVTLCLAILRLHTDKRRRCRFIIDKICAPLLESTDSRQVDATLLIEMIRSLLISTRIAIEETPKSITPTTTPTADDDNQDDAHERSIKSHALEIEQLNLYLDRLDVIRMMINANYGTKEMVGYVLGNNIQKLQERLLELERFELAVDLAKKYGLDSSSIWKTWAMICLKHFRFVEARRKFARYFDHHQATRSADVHETLRTIVDVLVRGNDSHDLQTASLAESGSPNCVKDKCSQIIAGKYDFLRLHHSRSTTGQATRPEIAANQRATTYLQPRIFEEIVYYHRQCGCGGDELLRFYVDHHYWREAVDHFIGGAASGPGSGPGSCVTPSVNGFVQELFITAQAKGSLGSLFAAIRQCDPTLTALWPALIGACRYLAKNRLFHSLYRVQIFMNDYLRAAITQINHFFLANAAQSFEDGDDDGQTDGETIAIGWICGFDRQFRRIAHLERARDNCNMYLHNIEFVQMKSGCLHVDARDVVRQIRLIETQIDIVKRFKHRQISYPLMMMTHKIDDDDDRQVAPASRQIPLCLRFMRAIESVLDVRIIAGNNVVAEGRGKNNVALPKSSTAAAAFSSSQSYQSPSSSSSSSFAQLPAPTLLEPDVTRKALISALLILYYCDKLEDGFRYSLRIIQDHCLNAKLVYKMSGILLIGYELERTPPMAATDGSLRPSSSSSSGGNDTIMQAFEQLLSFVRSTTIVSIDQCGDEDEDEDHHHYHHQHNNSNNQRDNGVHERQSSFGQPRAAAAAGKRRGATSNELGANEEEEEEEEEEDQDVSANPFAASSIRKSASRSVTSSMTSPSPSPTDSTMPFTDQMIVCAIRAIKSVLDDDANDNCFFGRSNSAHSSDHIVRHRLSELIESLSRLLSDDEARISAYLDAGKLKQAYLLAVSVGSRRFVQRVRQVAASATASSAAADHHYVKICDMWLRKNQAH